MKLETKTVLILVLLVVLGTGCSTAPNLTGPILWDQIQDGTYQGYYEGGLNSALVEVVIAEGVIVDIRILEHDALKGTIAEEPIVQGVLESQSLDVDTVTGATNSSIVILNAIQDALDKAYAA